MPIVATPMVEHIVSSYAGGEAGTAIAKRIHVTPNTVYRVLRRAGVDVPGWHDPKPRRRKMNDRACAEAISDYQNGMSLKELEAKYKVGQWSIRSAIKRAGLTLRDHGGQRRRVTADDENEICRLRDTGMSGTAIALSIKCHQSVVSRILRKNGRLSRGGWASHGAWKGGIAVDGMGYIKELVRFDDPMFCMAARSGYVLQHRLVMARSLGRPLLKHETVHHINGDRKDNSTENLQLRQGNHGNGVVMRCNCCGSHDVSAVEITEA